jgi:hypothetical protein
MYTKAAVLFIPLLNTTRYLYHIRLAAVDIGVVPNTLVPSCVWRLYIPYVV